MSGEETQAKGADGARRAKRWLDSTTRVNVQWVNPEPIAIPKLTFDWAIPNRTFSFDLAGVLLGEELAGQEFLAESKKYANASDQGTHYKKYLAQCYRAFGLRPERCDNFMWITWAPFRANDWDKLMLPEAVKSATVEYGELVFGSSDREMIAKSVSDDACKAVADRLWIIVLSERQEGLTLTNEHLGVIRQYETSRGS